MLPLIKDWPDPHMAAIVTVAGTTVRVGIVERVGWEGGGGLSWFNLTVNISFSSNDLDCLTWNVRDDEVIHVVDNKVACRVSNLTNSKVKFNIG